MIDFLLGVVVGGTVVWFFKEGVRTLLNAVMSKLKGAQNTDDKADEAVDQK